MRTNDWVEKVYEELGARDPKSARANRTRRDSAASPKSPSSTSNHRRRLRKLQRMRMRRNTPTAAHSHQGYDPTGSFG